ncbi:MAG: methionine--tRNA ligase subunit beta [Candidatus Omnitrophica bacterium]|nr:methionine--tRNA ligase subunit beta [Candidatus Omnitrophota bacterium]
MDEAGKSPTPAQPQPATPVGLLSIDDFKKLQLRVGIVTSAQDHPNADRLLILSVDIGEPTPRQLIAGIRGSYQAADLIGKHVVVVANLKPAMLRGVESQGMVLAASDSASIILVAPERPIAAGSQVK